MADDRHIANTGNLADDVRDTIIDQAGDRETLAFVQINLGFRAPRTDRRNEKTLNREGIRKIERADFRPHLQMNQPIRLDGRSKQKPDRKSTRLNSSHVS